MKKGDKTGTAEWAARELADETRPPEISLRRFVWLFLRTWPFMRPMLVHVIFLVLVWPFVMMAIGTFTGAITGDLWFNKILNGERLQPLQSVVLFLDDSYLKHDVEVARADERLEPAPPEQNFALDLVGPADLEAGEREELLDEYAAALEGFYERTAAIRLHGPQAVDATGRDALIDRVEEALAPYLVEPEVDWEIREDPPRWFWIDRERVAYATATVQTIDALDLALLESSVDQAITASGVQGAGATVYEQAISVDAWRQPVEPVPTSDSSELYGEAMLTVSGAMNRDTLTAIASALAEDNGDITPRVYELNQDQRRAVRNRSLGWFAFGALFGIVVYIGVIPYYSSWTWQNIIHYLRVSMIEKIEQVSLQFHSDSRVGDAIYRINQDSNQINSAVNEAIVEPITTFWALSIAAAFVVAFDPLLAGAIVLVTVPMVLLTMAFTPRLRRRSVANRVANSNLTSRLQETFGAMKIVKANRAEEIVLNRFNRDSHRALDAAIYYRLEMVLLSMLVMLMGGAAVIGLEYLMVSWTVGEPERPTYLGWAVVAWLGFRIWNLGAYSAANGRVGEVVGRGYGIVRWWSMLQDLFIGLERAFYFIDLKPDVVESEHPEDYPAPVREVAWQDVHFAYKSDKPVIRGANLSARAGTVTAIVGETGSGKSTLMSMLLRLYDPQAGRVSINGVDLKDLRVDDIRANSAIALQKNILFTGKIADNIGYAVPAASRADIEAAARVACADEFIQGMAEGYDSELGDRGGKLSAGQRQRLTIARAVIRNRPILILDEPTASLDAVNEQRVMANLAEWGRDKVVFLITHRLSTIRNADQIAFLEDGQIVETGTHDELMRVAEGRYRDFVLAETVGAEEGA